MAFVELHFPVVRWVLKLPGANGQPIIHCIIDVGIEQWGGSDVIGSNQHINATFKVAGFKCEVGAAREGAEGRGGICIQAAQAHAGLSETGESKEIAGTGKADLQALSFLKGGGEIRLPAHKIFFLCRQISGC